MSMRMGLAHPRTVNFITVGWMALVCVVVAIKVRPDRSTFFRFGPSDDLVLLGVVVDTATEYAVLVVYLVINVVVRNLNHLIVSPWFLHNVQNTERVRQPKID